jgi:hypothetical protein
MAEPVSRIDQNGTRFTSLSFRCLANTWRSKLPESSPVAIGNVLSYLDPLDRHTLIRIPKGTQSLEFDFSADRVIDRPDVQQTLFGESVA